MTETMANLELNTFMKSDYSDIEIQSNRRPLSIGIALTIVLLAACYLVSDLLVNERKKDLLLELKTRQEITVAGKADVIRTWINETGQRANQITNSPLIQLFASEVNKSDNGSLSKPLATQLPYMQNAITNFVKENKLIAAYMISPEGRAYLASNGAPSLTTDQRTYAVKHYTQKNVSTSAARVENNDLIFDFLVPVFSAQSDTSGKEETAVGVFVMTVSASEHLSNILKPTRLSLAGEATNLFQKKEGTFYELTPLTAPYLAEAPETSVSEIMESFEPRLLSSSSDPIYAVSTNVIGTDWTIVQSVPETTAIEPLQTYAYAIYGLAGSFFIVVISVLSGIWFSLKSQNARAMADQYKDLAQQINAQRRLLGSINNTVDDLISLKEPSGNYIYANPALARFVDFPEKSIHGKTDRDLFGDKIARKFVEMDASVTETGQTKNDILEIEMPAGTKIVRVQKSRLTDDNGAFIGIVTVAGDITEYITNQRQKEELGRKTISILVRMMEENDPHLAGHSHFMGELSSNVSNILSLSGAEKQTIATGANLSQIGKISIPVEIRTKESRLTREETVIMQGHVGKAKAMLSDMEIDAEVITAVSQMYERQDGSGYPNQLTGHDIDLSAQILGMADILIARVSPRTYRRAISVEEAMEVFRTNPTKYGPEIVVAFDNFLTSPTGKVFKEKLEQTAK
ncbi:hypothetical protein A9Q83_06875 [Alphaproteobacteria bacterium 46_93_T64]|nr:hypothetical protein A9Q83_06875 [Alphaproteobacteria bacterium 46_93_T64]